MSCFLFHDWIYQEFHIGECNIDGEVTAQIFNQRTCSKCGRIQKNKGYFEVSWRPYYWVNRWRTIGYVGTLSKQETSEK